MNDYNGVSGKERIRIGEEIKKAIKVGIIPSPKKCGICDKTTGRIDYHSEKYLSATENLFPICQGCHTRWHNRNRFPKAFKRFLGEQHVLSKVNEEMKESIAKESLID